MQFTRSLGPALAVLAAIAAVPAQAQVTQLTASSQLSGADPTYGFSGKQGDIVPSPLVLQGSGNTLTLTAAGGTFFRQDSDGATFDFAANVPLLQTNNAGSTGTPTGPLTITFANGVAEFGLSAQDRASDTEAFSFTVVGTTSGSKTFNLTPVDNSLDQGAAVFLGASAGSGNLISQVIISSVSTSAGIDTGASNDFYIGPISAAPEPSPLAALGVGVVGLSLLGWKIQRRKPAAVRN